MYQIGVEDNGLLVGLTEEDMKASLKTLRRMAEKYVFILIGVIIIKNIYFNFKYL